MGLRNNARKASHNRSILALSFKSSLYQDKYSTGGARCNKFNSFWSITSATSFLRWCVFVFNNDMRRPDVCYLTHVLNDFLLVSFYDYSSFIYITKGTHLPEMWLINCIISSFHWWSFILMKFHSVLHERIAMTFLMKYRL